jgi:U3 small nucleolar RNA-associated protein 14
VTKPASHIKRNSRSRATAKALDAFGLASEAVPEKRKHLRTKDLDVEPVRKRARREDDDDEEQDGDSEDGEDDIDEDGARRMRKAPRRQDDEDAADSDFGSDSEGNEWQVGQDRGDDDSDIDSDEAFGEGDEERFEGFTFGGSSSNTAKRPKGGAGSADGSEEEGDEVDDDSLGDDAIDLADVLDQASDSDDVSGDASMSESGEDGESSFGGLSDDDDEERDSTKLQSLKDLASDFAGSTETDTAALSSSTGGAKTKVSLSDLGLDTVKDRDMRKSLKLLAKEEKAVAKPGSGKRLDVPVARRQQDRLLRIAATEKANATLDRWTDTVKHNRRAEHLIFPLPQSQPGSGLDNSELAPFKEKKAVTELEKSIMAIMRESGLMPTKEQGSGPQANVVDPLMDSISRAEVQKEWAQRRRERELHSREQARARKIKKIKSKAWHRVHRKERARMEMAEQEAAAANRELNSDEEADAQDRRRALERVGARHKESKWAKMGARTGRAVWDEEFKEGMKDLVKKDEELRRRVEGRGVRAAEAQEDEEEDENDDEDGDSHASQDDEERERRRLLKQIEQAEAELNDAPESRLMAMPFMQRAEAELRKENDAMAAQIKRDLDPEAGSDEEDPSQPEEIGRRSYGLRQQRGAGLPKDGLDAEEERDVGSDGESDRATREAHTPAVGAASKPSRREMRPLKLNPPTPVMTSEPNVDEGDWSRRPGQNGTKSGNAKCKKAVEVDLDLSSTGGLPRIKKKAEKQKRNGPEDDDGSTDDEAEAAMHHPLAIRDQEELVQRAFADDDTIAVDFAREKAAMASDDEEKTIDNTLPGWGSWVGEGVSERDKRRHTGRFLTKVDAVKKKADRRDAKLDRVIISERRVKKNERYLASALPFPFENKQQYEQSLRLSVGPEWMTKETFQSATKPRIIVKQGVIAPMARPMM